MKKKNSFRRIFTFMNKHIYAYFFGLITVGLLLAFFQIQLAKLFQYMFDSFELQEFDIARGIINYLIYIIIILTALPFFSYLVRRVNVISSGNLRKAISNKLTKLPASYFKKHHSGDIISRSSNDVSETERSYSSYLYLFIINLIMGVISIAFTFYLEWRLAIISLSAGLLILFINMFYAKILRRTSTKVQEKLGRLNERFSNILAGIQVIRVFNIYNIIMKKYLISNDDVYKYSKERVKKQAVMVALNNMVGFISFLGIAAVGAYLSIKGEITFGIIIAVVQLQNGVTNLVYGLGSFITQMQTSLAAADRVFELLDEEEEPAIYNLENVQYNNSKDILGFKKVLFSYEDEIVLNKISFSIPKNKVYALVGPSGGGKSTIFKMILNFYPPKEGDIFINGNSISNQTINEVRNLIAYVPQDAYLFTGTILENIAYGKTNATIDEIIEAAKLANADKFISQLEHGYNTEVGEGGAQLSGGQRQRIAIARAILKDAPILLLDEATSALDSESEQLVQRALDMLMIKKTTLIIAHRLSTVQYADQILVVKDGIIVEQGTHDSLLENKDGVYTKLYNQQFATN